LIENGIDVDLFVPQNKAQIRSVYGLQPDACIVAFTMAETWDQFKGSSFLIEALKHLKPDKQVTLLILGRKGALQDLYERFTVREVGWIRDRKRLADLIACADVYVQPSLAEAFGLAVVEAMSCGVPVVGSNVGGIPEIIRAPSAGLVVPARDSAALAQAITTLLENDNLRQQMSVNAREIAVREYGLDLQVDRYLHMYERVIEERKCNG
jgi:glycosyltransferase involved in cell wall biosynthesis